MRILIFLSKNHKFAGTPNWWPNRRFANLGPCGKPSTWFRTGTSWSMMCSGRPRLFILHFFSYYSFFYSRILFFNPISLFQKIETFLIEVPLILFSSNRSYFIILIYKIIIKFRLILITKCLIIWDNKKIWKKNSGRTHNRLGSGRAGRCVATEVTVEHWCSNGEVRAKWRRSNDEVTVKQRWGNDIVSAK